MVLNYKKIPYETQWLDLPDIKPTLQSLGVESSVPQTAGASVGAQYTLPGLRLPSGEYIMDSAAIARKLDALYPEPSLHMDLALHEQAQVITRKIAMPLFPLIMPRIRDRLITDHALGYWTKTREAVFGMSVDAFAKSRGSEAACWEAAEPGLEELTKFLTAHKKDEGPFVLGSEVCYADFVVAGFLLESIRRIDGKMFQRVVGPNGRVKELYTACEPWLEMDR